MSIASLLRTPEEQLLIELEKMNKIEAEMCKRNLLTFVRKTWHLVEPKKDFIDTWHIAVLCQVLMQITRGELDSRAIINIPPGLMKSLLVSVFWKAWMWASDPSLRFLGASYSDHLSLRDNMRLKAIVTSKWYRDSYGLELSGDQNAKEMFKTTKGGWSFATSVGGAATGEHPDYATYDDPLTALQARSDAERKRVIIWLDETMSTRGIVRGIKVVLIMQRLHEEDPAGHLQKKGWLVVRFPMRYEKCSCASGDPTTTPEEQRCAPHRLDPAWRPDPRDTRTEVGELLAPALLPEEKVRQLELDLGPYGTAGQLQQRPGPEGGGLFKREWFHFINVVPAQARRIVRGWDTGATEGGGDYTASCKMSEANNIFYIEDAYHEQLSPAGVDTLIVETTKADGISVAQREQREGGSAGKTVTAVRAKTLKGWNYKEVMVSHDKVTLAMPFRSQCEAGNVCIVRGPWNEAFIRELTQFPTGKHDDFVDAASTAFNAVVLEPRPGPPQVRKLAGFG